MTRGPKENAPGWNTISGDYRQYLFEKGLERLADESTGCKGRLGFTAEQVEHEIKRRGKLPLHKVMLYRVRYFTDGVIIGSESFVNQVFAKLKTFSLSPGNLMCFAPERSCLEEKMSSLLTGKTGTRSDG